MVISLVLFIIAVTLVVILSIAVSITILNDLIKEERVDNKDCRNCKNYKKMTCPNSFKCYATKDKPYFIERGN